MTMNERHIWRPNSFTPEEWEKLSREQQITWWKDQVEPEPKGPAIHPLWAVRGYAKGIITKAECLAFVFTRLTEGNEKEFLVGCPADVLRQLQEEADRLPANDDDQGWGQLISIESACYFPWVTDQEIQQGQKETRRRFREGVAVFRKCR
jgi:hypothetical protein